MEDIRSRISSAELRPGDRVPSASRITQEWGVAIATATKVLAALQRKGLVRVVPGVGTVVSPAGPVALQPRTPKRRPSAREPQPELGTSLHHLIAHDQVHCSRHLRAPAGSAG